MAIKFGSGKLQGSGGLTMGSLTTGSLTTGSLTTGSLTTGSLTTGSLTTGSLTSTSLSGASLDSSPRGHRRHNDHNYFSLDTSKIDDGYKRRKPGDHRPSRATSFDNMLNDLFDSFMRLIGLADKPAEGPAPTSPPSAPAPDYHLAMQKYGEGSVRFPAAGPSNHELGEFSPGGTGPSGGTRIRS